MDTKEKITINFAAATTHNSNTKKNAAGIKLILTSLVGCFIFFTPLPINGTTTIIIDHVSTWIKELIGNGGLLFYIGLMAVAGSLLAIVDKSWKKGFSSIAIMLFKFLGTILTLILCLEIGPAWLMAEDVGGWLIYRLLAAVTLVVPIGGTLLVLLTDFGLLEFIGAFVQPFMYRMFRTSGRSAICIVSSFVGSFSVGLLMTDKLYCEKKFTYKESVIIATGFSTISASFMVVIAKTLDIMDYWLVYFWASFLVTCIVTFICARIWPIRNMPDSLYHSIEVSNIADRTQRTFAQIWHQAVSDSMKIANESPQLLQSLRTGVKNGFKMGASITPTVIGGAFVGIVLCEYTRVFDYIGYIFYPLFRLLNVSQPLEAGKAIALSITESMVPTVAVMEASLQTRFIIGLACVSTILFIAGTIPCIMATRIRISFAKIIMIWLERAILSVFVASLVGLVVFQFM